VRHIPEVICADVEMATLNTALHFPILAGIQRSETSPLSPKNALCRLCRSFGQAFCSRMQDTSQTPEAMHIHPPKTTKPAIRTYPDLSGPIRTYPDLSGPIIAAGCTSRLTLLEPEISEASEIGPGKRLCPSCRCLYNSDQVQPEVSAICSNLTT